MPAGRFRANRRRDDGIVKGRFALHLSAWGFEAGTGMSLPGRHVIAREPANGAQERQGDFGVVTVLDRFHFGQAAVGEGQTHFAVGLASIPESIDLGTTRLPTNPIRSRREIVNTR